MPLICLWLPLLHPLLSLVGTLHLLAPARANQENSSPSSSTSLASTAAHVPMLNFVVDPRPHIFVGSDRKERVAPREATLIGVFLGTSGQREPCHCSYGAASGQGGLLPHGAVAKPGASLGDPTMPDWGKPMSGLVVLWKKKN